jgi:hypothetical protein
VRCLLRRQTVVMIEQNIEPGNRLKGIGVRYFGLEYKLTVPHLQNWEKDNTQATSCLILFWNCLHFLQDFA